MSAMPQWILLLLFAIGAWLVAAVGGGLLLGRLLRRIEPHLPHSRRPIA